MKYLIYILALLSVSCHPAYAEQSVDWYGKLAYNYHLDQPDIVVKHDFSAESYSLEYGLEIDPDGWESYRFGLYWFEPLRMDSYSKKIYNPKFLEIFGEKAYNISDYYFRIGGGYKLYQQTEIFYVGKTSGRILEDSMPVITNWLDRASARFSVGKKIGQWEVELNHHSNWFVGKPFNDRWEYHNTSISVGLIF